MRKNLYRIVLAFFALFLTTQANGQFYDGTQMTFGKNRLQYYDYYWMYYRFDDFDCYFNEQGRELAQFTANYAMKKLDEIEDFFDYNIEKRIIFIIHNNNAEFKQNNIGLPSSISSPYNTGGYSRIIDNKVSLYYETDHIAFQKQISASIAEVIINELLYDAEKKDRISGASRITTPDWYIKGLMNYVAENWDFETENRVKDGITSGKYKKINNLEYEDAVYAGQSFWKYIGQKYGNSIIPNIIYITKIYKKIDKGFLYVIGKTQNELLDEWYDYYRNLYQQENTKKGYTETTFAKAIKEQIYQQVKVSPDGRYTAYVTNDWGRRRIWLYDESTGKKKIIFRKEPKMEQDIDKTYPVIGWHPSGQILTFINEEKGSLKLYFYRLDEKKTEKRNMLYFDKVLSFEYSPEGTRLVLSAVKDGVTDIYVHTIASGTNEQITRDVADDLTPSFLAKERNTIIFSSNRLSDTLTNTGSPFERVGLTFDLFTYDLTSRNKILTRLDEDDYADRYMPEGNTSDDISFISNKNGVLNRYEASFDSTINYIDTAVHYRYFINSKQVTDFDRNIESSSVSQQTGKQRDGLFYNGRFILSKDDAQTSSEITLSKERIEPYLQLNDAQTSAEITPYTTVYRQERDELLHKADSIEQLRLWLIEEDRKRRDTLTKPLYEYYNTNEPIDVTHYTFEQEKQNYYDNLWRKDYMDIKLDTGELKVPTARIYETAFYYNYMSTQLNYNFLNNSYQVYSGGSSYYNNPGLNILSTIGTIDLFENYRITGGFTFSGDFDNNEYLLGFENLKGKFDKQILYHRQSYYASSTYSIYKIHTNNINFSLTRPFTRALSIRGTLAYRLDRQISMAYDLTSLDEKSQNRHWPSVKGEIIYDNIREKIVNIYYGTRFKIFGEFYKEIPAKKSEMFVVGVDFRHYTKIHRELIWANRFAASSSFGPTKLLYYLGGVDEWVSFNLFNQDDHFDQTTPINPNVNYGFQTLATNMRGFLQNTRNGNNFAVINSEIRWPVIRYFAGHPLKSNFLNSLQVVGFADIGTAWTGATPWSGKNAYDIETFENGPISVVLDSNRDPIIYGVGFGARAQLMGYFLRADLAWGIDNGYVLPKQFYLSLSLDF